MENERKLCNSKPKSMYGRHSRCHELCYCAFWFVLAFYCGLRNIWFTSITTVTVYLAFQARIKVCQKAKVVLFYVLKWKYERRFTHSCSLCPELYLFC